MSCSSAKSHDFPSTSSQMPTASCGRDGKNATWPQFVTKRNRDAKLPVQGHTAEGYCGKVLQKGGLNHHIVGSQGVLSGLTLRALPAVSTCTARAHTHAHTHMPQPHTSRLPWAQVLHFRGSRGTDASNQRKGLPECKREQRTR